jgi:hypothetical protein
MRRNSPNSRIYSDSIRRFYMDHGLSFREISDILLRDYGVYIGHTTVAKILRDQGIDTAKSAAGGHRDVTCPCCGTVHQTHRSRVHLAPGRDRHHYCDGVCWRVYLEEHSKGQQAARRMVEDILGRLLPAEAVCHFVDGDSGNVLRRNIKVYTSTARHLEEHRRVESQ